MTQKEEFETLIKTLPSKVEYALEAIHKLPSSREASIVESSLAILQVNLKRLNDLYTELYERKGEA